MSRSLYAWCQQRKHFVGPLLIWTELSPFVTDVTWALVMLTEKNQPRSQGLLRFPDGGSEKTLAHTVIHRSPPRHLESVVDRGNEVGQKWRRVVLFVHSSRNRIISLLIWIRIILENCASKCETWHKASISRAIDIVLWLQT